MSQYSIILPNDKSKAYNKISLLILAVNLLAFGLLFFKQSTLAAYTAAAIMMLVISGCLFSYVSKNVQLQNKLTIITIGLCAISWVIAGDYILGLLMAVVAAVSYYTLQKPVLHITDLGIAYPSFPKTFYQWKDVTQVLIKDEILSIDLKNNNLLQFRLEEQVAADLNRSDLNQYAKQMILSAASVQ